VSHSIISYHHLALFYQIKQYVFEDPEFEETFKQWAEENAHHIDLTAPADEHKLEYTALHQQVREVPLARRGRSGITCVLLRSQHVQHLYSQFTELFNKKLDEKIEDEQVTTGDVFERLAADAENDESSEVC